MRSSYSWFACAALLACGGSDEPSGPNLVGGWRWVEAADAQAFDLRADKSALVIEEKGTLRTCQKGTWAFGDGIFTVETPDVRGGPQPDRRSFRAEFPDADTMRLDGAKTFRRVAVDTVSCPP